MIGSVQKLIGGLLCAQLVAQGHVGLNQPAELFLPKGRVMPLFPTDPQPITLLQLADFSSGLPNRNLTLDAQLREATSHTEAVEAVYNFLGNYTLTRAPGSAYEYSDIGAPLLALLMANKLNQTYSEAAHRTVLRPLKMYHTNEFLPINNLVQGYDFKTGKTLHTPEELTFSATGAPQTHATVNDFIKFLQAHLNLTQTPLAEAIRITQDAPSFNMSNTTNQKVRFFWIVTDNTHYFKNGLSGYYDYATAVVYDRRVQAGVVIFTNTNIKEVVDQFANQILVVLSKVVKNDLSRTHK
jgi:CubicO group peptidase (beta-lactamase class C family)